MSTTFPGTTIEVKALEKGSSKLLFDGIFATGGITLSQISVMTGLEPYLIQNWVKRGFVTSPKKRVYSREQFARIIIINMLREALQIDRICGLIRIIGGVLDDPDDDLIGDDELYHKYVDMLASGELDMTDKETVRQAAEDAILDFEERRPDTKKQLVKILQVMLYAHAASELRKSAEDILATLE
ncbi:MAG: DUF1836 domain-containing protein [Clostridia bacterium]|nr:DUF1836 domain-containing protein [Clostridia bacterium]